MIFLSVIAFFYQNRRFSIRKMIFYQKNGFSDSYEVFLTEWSFF